MNQAFVFQANFGAPQSSNQEKLSDNATVDFYSAICKKSGSRKTTTLGYRYMINADFRF